MLCVYRVPVQGENERTRQSDEPSRQDMVIGPNGIEGKVGTSIRRGWIQVRHHDHQDMVSTVCSPEFARCQCLGLLSSLS
jgi:hypothetical protein